jgi:hypothetical protein
MGAIATHLVSVKGIKGVRHRGGYFLQAFSASFRTKPESGRPLSALILAFLNNLKTLNNWRVLLIGLIYFLIELT